MNPLDVSQIVRVLVILAAGVLASFGVRRVGHWIHTALVEKVVDHDAERRAVTLVRAAQYVLGAAVALIVVMLLLTEFGISIAPLLGAAGIAGVAIGLAAQSVARDFLRGFSLLLGNQLRVGDVVEIAGKSGAVEELTLGYVRLREFDGTVHFVRTGQIETVTNRSFGRVYAVLDVAVDTDADLGASMRVMRDAADALAADPEWRSRVAGPVEIAGIERWEGDAVVLRARVPTEPHSQAVVRRELLARVKAGLDAAGVPNPTQRLRLVRERH